MAKCFAAFLFFTSNNVKKPYNSIYKYKKNASNGSYKEDVYYS